MPFRYRLAGGAVLDLRSSIVSDGSEQGLLGLTFSSDGQRLYVAYTGTDSQQHLDEYGMNGAAVDTRSRREILVAPDFAANHNGGQLAFGPDGSSTGAWATAAAAATRRAPARTLAICSGRSCASIPTVATPTRSRPTIPSTRRAAGGVGVRAAQPLALLVRPRRATCGSATSANPREEVTLLPRAAGGGRGANLGWSNREGDQPYNGGGEPDDHVAPLLTYAHNQGGCSVTGGFVYRGSAIPALTGAYLYADYCIGEIRAAVQSGGRVVKRGLGTGVPSLSSFGQDSQGELFASRSPVLSCGSTPGPDLSWAPSGSGASLPSCSRWFCLQPAAAAARKTPTPPSRSTTRRRRRSRG